MRMAKKQVPRMSPAVFETFRPVSAKNDAHWEIACVMYAMQQAVSVCLNVNFISDFLFMILYIFLQIAQNTCKNENYMIQCI